MQLKKANCERKRKPLRGLWPLLSKTKVMTFQYLPSSTGTTELCSLLQNFWTFCTVHINTIDSHLQKSVDVCQGATTSV